MSDALVFALVSPDARLFAGEVARVDMPGWEGELGVLAQHAPFVTGLRAGVLHIREAGGATQSHFLFGGFAEMGKAGLSVLAGRAVPLEDLQGRALQAELDAAQKRWDEEHSTRARARLGQLMEALRALNASVLTQR